MHKIQVDQKSGYRTRKTPISAQPMPYETQHFNLIMKEMSKGVGWVGENKTKECLSKQRPVHDVMTLMTSLHVQC